MTHTMLRHFLGFDPEMFESVNTNYPRYNVVRTDEESVSVEVAVPGFTKEEVKVAQDGNSCKSKQKQSIGCKRAKATYIKALVPKVLIGSSFLASLWKLIPLD